MTQKFLLGLAALLGLVLAALIATPVSAQPGDPPRMSKETLRGLLGSPDLLILDVRIGNDWRDSDAMIQGAVRKPPELFDTWSSEVPHDKMVVLYCA